MEGKTPAALFVYDLLGRLKQRSFKCFLCSFQENGISLLGKLNPGPKLSVKIAQQVSENQNGQVHWTYNKFIQQTVSKEGRLDLFFFLMELGPLGIKNATF